MKYLEEIRQNWRPLLAATIGMGSGMSMAGVITTTIAPTMMHANNWKPSDFAMVGSFALIASFSFPFVGRLADVIGSRYTALIGQVTLPLAFLAYSMMNGDLSVYIAIFVIQSLICVTTTATVYSRIAVQYIKGARGLALAIVASGPALSGIVMAPILNDFVEAHGWRASYQALAIFAAIAGTIVFFLIPHSKATDAAAAKPPKRHASKDYPLILRTPAFWILLASMALCNLPATILLVQLKLLLLANGVIGANAGFILSMSSIGMLAGRILTGIALDRFQPYLVSFITLCLPSLGLFAIASSYDATIVLTIAVFFIGFAFGAEGDVVAYLVARQFGVGIYSSVMGLLTMVISLSTASGALLLGITMAQTGGYNLYLMIAGFGVIIGASLLLLLGRMRQPEALIGELEPAPQA